MECLTFHALLLIQNSCLNLNDLNEATCKSYFQFGHSEIKRIIVAGSKRTGYSVTMRTKGFIGISNYTIQFENALTTGEIKGSGMTSDDALAELKKAKDKLDLGLITQEQYDQIKSDLTKFIK